MKDEEGLSIPEHCCVTCVEGQLEPCLSIFGWWYLGQEILLTLEFCLGLNTYIIATCGLLLLIKLL